MGEYLKRLDWDSDFFNFNVARIEGSINDPDDLKKIEESIHGNNIRLSYYSSNKKLPEFVNKSKVLDFSLVDRKITYSKLINSEIILDSAISSIWNDTSDDKLKKLAIESGIFSRFKVDPRIETKKFEDLYRLWMINSLNRTIAKEVLVYKMDNQIAGFVTIGEKNERADIGIIAVDPLFQGKGIGKLLMKAAEKWSSEKGYKLLQVVTQEDNITACKLYERCTFSAERKEYFYHIWKRTHSTTN